MKAFNSICFKTILKQVIQMNHSNKVIINFYFFLTAVLLLPCETA